MHVETDVEVLLARAVEASRGLDDFGDPSFRPGLEAFVASAAAEASLSPIGEASVEVMVGANLVNRLRVVDWAKGHPEVATAPVTAPLVLVGLPRTGTTALSHLLSADPANRSLLAWEVNDSVPPPTTATYRTDPRFVAAMEAPDALSMLNPEFKAIHHDPPDMPVECATVLGQHFASLHLATVYNVDGYLRWLLAADHAGAYRYHRLVLQVLQSQCPGRWQLKSPVHLVDPWSMAATYPDATYVLTHRDPVRVTASVLSLVRSLTGTFAEGDPTAYVAATWPELVGTLLDRQTRFREEQEAAGNGAAFVDVAYADLVADPVGTVRSIYAAAGRDLSPEAEAALQHHAAAHPQGAHGTHRYSLEEFGLSADDLRDRFAGYTDRYRPYLEPSR